jgi:hypothetical protein
VFSAHPNDAKAGRERPVIVIACADDGHMLQLCVALVRR